MHEPSWNVGLQLTGLSTVMNGKHFTSRRSYNRWVANQTLEDFALRFTAKKARRWSTSRVVNTAMGSISFLALEAIGAAVTFLYGFDATLTATMAVSAIIFLTAIPISYYAARYGVDIDLLSRGAGFGYIGSTITSLIYATFTFIFLALESAIMASAMEILFGVPLWLGYLISILVVIPLVTHGITQISRFQLWSQPVWLLLQITPFIFILWHEWTSLGMWTDFQGIRALPESPPQNLNLIYFGAASAVMFSLMAQIGEQVDFLRFLPEPEKGKRLGWWLGLMAAGPGWVLIGILKIMAGSFLAVLALSHGLQPSEAADPTHMYLLAFSYLMDSPMAIIAVTGIFVVLCQVKINVTNAYAGSIAWSNFFSRLTHSHPGRVVWLFFNVIIALMLMALGVYDSLEHILGIYSNVAVAWVGALVADLVVNKPLGLSPKHIEFKRAHLYDVNPVGFGAMFLASLVGILAYSGLWGPVMQAMSSYLSLTVAFVTAPLIAWLTHGRYYLAREIIPLAETKEQHVCVVCDNRFEAEDIATCPAYAGHICSLCCSLESRCHDQCKTKARITDQVEALLVAVLPDWIIQRMNPRVTQFTGFMMILGSLVGVMFWLVYQQVPDAEAGRTLVGATLLQVYVLLFIIIGVLIWLVVLANESRLVALEEAMLQTELLREEISAHEKTDRALQLAKESADAANQAKSRYLSGISHELRSPLNAILGYAQILHKDQTLSDKQRGQVGIISHSGDHLADLIEGLLDVSRIEAGRLDIRSEEVAIRELLDNLVAMFRTQAESKGIAFIYQPSPYLPAVVRTDEKHLRQILINLLSNAVKYTQEGSVTFSVRYRSQVAEFSICDTGTGIDASEHERIFQPFERIRKPGSAQAAGTGLGLTISQLLADIMGGEISLESEPGQGSCFRLTMMLSSVAKASIKAEVPKRVAGYHGPVRTIMVVDDDASHRGVVSEILTPLGFVILEAPDAEACLQACRDASIDLFLLDISMPGMSGWELLQALRDHGVTVPIVMLSADAEHSVQEITLARQPDHNAYLIKPLRDRFLLDTLARVLGLEWFYELLPLRTEKSLPAAPPSGDELPQDLPEKALRTLISHAEVGYIQGIEQTLDELAQYPSASDFIRLTRSFLSALRFQDIVSLCYRVIRHE